MKEVTIKEFSRNPSKILAENEEFLITKRGEPSHIVSKYVPIGNQVIAPGKYKECAEELMRKYVPKKYVPEKVTPKYVPGHDFDTHGCGCEKKDKPLCSKHGRH